MRPRCAAVSAEDRGTWQVFHIILRLRRQRDGRVFPRGETKRHRKTIHAVALRLNVRGVLIPYSRVERLVASDFSIRADSGFEKEFKLFPCGGIAVCGQPARLRELPEKDFFDLRFAAQGASPFGELAARINQRKRGFAEVVQNGKNLFVVRRIPVEDFIVMKKQADNFRAVGVDPFVAGIAAPVIVVEKTVAEISVQHVIDA